MLATQVKISIPVVIKANLLPALVVMAGLALGSITPLVPLVLVVLAVTANARFFGSRVFLVGMTLLAHDIGMLAADQMEICLFMIKAGFLPIFCIMAVAAIIAKLAFVHILLAVAGVTFGRCLAIFCLWLVAIRTFRKFMFIIKDKICFVVLEADPVKFRNPCIPPLVFGMAITAFLFLDAPVIALLAADIRCRLLVTIKTKASLRILVETFMTVGTLSFILGMILDHLAGHHRAFQRLRRSPLRQQHEYRQAQAAQQANTCSVR